MLRRLYIQYKDYGMDINIEKTKLLAANANHAYEILISEGESIKEVDKFKYLGTLTTKEGIGSPYIQLRIEQARRVLGSLNSIWWDKNISKNTKLCMGKTLVESVLCYNSEVWVVNAKYKQKLLAVEMLFELFEKKRRDIKITNNPESRNSKKDESRRKCN